MVVRVLAAASMAAAAHGCGDRPLRLEIDLCVFVPTGQPCASRLLMYGASVCRHSRFSCRRSQAKPNTLV
jgi:hypothetical protein